MQTKDLFLLTHVRKDMRFFVSRLIIGFILTISIFYSGIIDSEQVISEIQSKQLLLLLVTLALCIPMYIVWRFRPRNTSLRKAQKMCIFFCETITSILRSALVMGVATLIFCIVIDKNIALLFTCINFLMSLEYLTYIHSQWDSFEIGEDKYITLFSFVVGSKKDEASKK